MKRLKFLLLLLLPLAMLGAESSGALLDRAVAALHASKSITADYSISSSGSSSRGSITVCGNRFKITVSDLKVWYDGKTQWTLVPSEGEVSICEPTAAELQQINPFAIVDSHMRVYTSRLLKSANPAERVVELNARDPKASGGISRVVVTLDASSLMPRKLVITMSSRSVVTVSVGTVTRGNTLPAADFRPAAASLKGLEIVDLR